MNQVASKIKQVEILTMVYVYQPLGVSVIMSLYNESTAVHSYLLLSPCSVSSHLSAIRANLGSNHCKMFHRNGLGRIWLTRQTFLSSGLSLKQVRRVNIPLAKWIVGYFHEYLLISGDFTLGFMPSHIQENGNFERRNIFYLVSLR